MISPGFASMVISASGLISKFDRTDSIISPIDPWGKYDGVPPPKKMVLMLGALSTFPQRAISVVNAFTYGVNKRSIPWYVLKSQ